MAQPLLRQALLRTSSQQCLIELLKLAQGRPEQLEVARAKRDRTAARDTVGRVGEADEAFAALELQELHHRGESTLAGTLRKAHLSTSAAAPHAVSIFRSFGFVAMTSNVTAA